MTQLPSRPPEGKVRYKAVYHDPKQSPFAEPLTQPTKTVDVDAALAIGEVERLAREGSGPYVFVRVERIGV